jgi:hypothetical protein
VAAVTSQKIRNVLGGPLAKLMGIPITRELLGAMGQSLVQILAAESKTYFAKRGWDGHDPMGGEPIWRSFTWKIRGKSTLEISSTFYGMSELANGDIPSRRMTWLTQQAKDQHPENYELSPKEKRLKMKKAGRVLKGERLPLIVPIQTQGGSVEFRTAPLTIGDAWIHPGIARFTFYDTAVRKWRQQCADIVAKAVAEAISEASS